MTRNTEQELREGMAKIIKIATECELTWQEGKAEAMKGYLKDAMSLIKAVCYFKDDPGQPWLSIKETTLRFKLIPELMKPMVSLKHGQAPAYSTQQLEPPYSEPC